MKFSPWGAVGGFVAPIAWLFLPYLIMGELWRATEPHSHGDEWKEERVPLWYHFWWITFLAFMIAWYLGVTSGPEQTDTALLFAVPLVWISAALAILLVRGIEERLASRRRLRSWAG